MTSYFTTYPELVLPSNIMHRLISQPTQDLEQRYQGNLTFWTMLRECLRNRINPVGVFNYYGWSCRHIGNIVYYAMPSDIEQSILAEWNFLKIWPEPPIMRMQIIFGGREIPMHIDRTRACSLIVPLINHTKAVTGFFESRHKNPRRGMVDPSVCVLKCQVRIDQHPVLLNTDVIHNVSELDADVPRISLSLKWQNSSYRDIKSFLDLQLNRSVNAC